ncbi:MAG: hypothetical protein ACU836_09640 [Gammaproteobacteria bacterium]
MNKYVVLSLLMLTAGNVEAHSHPSVHALTHAIEHMAINAQAWGTYWLPYLFTLAVLTLCAILSQNRRSRRLENRRRSK